MDIGRLKIEVIGDPGNRGYAQMSDAQVAADGHQVYCTLPKESLSGNDMFSATDPTEWAGLDSDKRQLWVSWCSTDRDPFNAANVAFVQYIFGDDSATVNNLQALRIRAVSRWTELRLGDVYETHVTHARSYHDS